MNPEDSFAELGAGLNNQSMGSTKTHFQIKFLKISQNSRVALNNIFKDFLKNVVLWLWPDFVAIKEIYNTFFHIVELRVRVGENFENIIRLSPDYSISMNGTWL